MTTAASTENGTSASARAGRGLHIGLWIAQGLLAAAFFMAGSMKLALPIEQLAEKMPWVQGSLGSLVRFIGLAEVLGAIGLILPSATRIQPRLTILASMGLTIVMTLAVITHVARGELAATPPSLSLGLLAAFVAWGRAKKAPVSAR